MYHKLQNLCGISNEILFILVAQGAAKLLKVKVEGLKKNEKRGRSHNEYRKKEIDSIFLSQTLTSSHLQPFEIRIHSISFESPHKF